MAGCVHYTEINNIMYAEKTLDYTTKPYQNVDISVFASSVYKTTISETALD